jgi:tetratricopeptide (TPR) repeat protein
MGLMSWLFPSEEDRLSKARKLVERGSYAEARGLAESLSVEGAAVVAAQAREGLAKLNADEAVACANAGQFERAEEHLELALQFAGAPTDVVKAARREVREIRQAATVKAKRGAQLANDPSIQSPPGVGGDPLYSLPPDDPRLRYAMALEAWPEDLRERLVALGPEFAQGVNLIEDGDPEAAIQALTPFIEREPAARYERSRAAQAAGNLALAASDLAAFADAVGHQTIGRVHTGALLGGLLAQQGRVQDALAAVDRGLASEPDSMPLQGTRAMVLEGLGRFEEADELARSLVKKAPRDLGLYRLMARCRVRGGKRVEAMQVLEAGLSRNCTSGRCGAQPFDVEAGRMLARLYLEDRLDDSRAAELIGQIKSSVRQPGPFEAYLDALMARNGADPGATDAARRLLGSLKPQDPLRQVIAEAFPETTRALT